MQFLLGSCGFPSVLDGMMVMVGLWGVEIQGDQPAWWNMVKRPAGLGASIGVMLAAWQWVGCLAPGVPKYAVLGSYIDIHSHPQNNFIGSILVRYFSKIFCDIHYPLQSCRWQWFPWCLGDTSNVDISPPVLVWIVAATFLSCCVS